MHTETRYPAFFQQQLARVTEALLQPIPNIAAAIRNTEDYYALLMQAASFDAQSEGSRNDIVQSTGKAIAPIWAAYCVRDVHRTRTFIRGVIQAVRAAQKQFPNQKLHLLYVGPGPFATLVLPLTRLFGPEEIQFTLLEINPASIVLLHNTVKAFGIERYIVSIEQTDAATYQVKQPVHLLLLETMQAALRQEPQVAITLNLVPQIIPGGFLLPEAITVTPGLINGGKHLEYVMAHEPGLRDYYYTAEPIMQLNLEFARVCTAVDKVIFPLHRTIFSKAQLQAFKQPALFTEIKVFGTEILAYWDSQLSEPYLLMQPYPDEADAVLCLQYEISSTPGFRYHWE